MSCQSFRRMLGRAAQGASSPGLDLHVAGCRSCREVLAAEKALLDRIDTELRDTLEIEPSIAFLPAVRRRVAELQAVRETARRRRWLLPALASLTAVLVTGYLTWDIGPEPGVREPLPAGTARATEAEETGSSPGRALGDVVPATERSAPRLPAASPGDGPAAREPRVVPALPRAFVPAEDGRAVRHLARRLRGRPARAAVATPEIEGVFDFALRPVPTPSAAASFDEGLWHGAEPHVGEPLLFDHTIDKAWRET